MNENIERMKTPEVGLKVLVVDDGLVGRKMMAYKLTALGFEVACAGDGAEALELLRVSVPDAVITDLHMPKLGGFDLCRAMRHDPLLRSVPVIVTSASEPTPSDLAEAAEAGANAFTIRNADMKEVVAALLSALGAAKA